MPRPPASYRIARCKAMRFAHSMLVAVCLSLAGAHGFAQDARDRFTDGSRVAQLPFEWREGMIFVPVRVNGSAPLHFILDTGSTRMLIDRGIARRLGIVTTTSGSLQGAGAGRIAIENASQVSIDLPGLTSASYAFSTIDLTATEASLHVPVDGIIGYEFFARFVVTIDYQRRQLKITAPAAFHPDPSAASLPLKVSDKWARVPGTLEIDGPVTIDDWFLLDSGSSDAVDHPFAKAVADHVVSASGVGLGTPIEGAVGHAISFRLGPYRLQKPVVSCCGATDATSRLIGNEVLRRFTVTVDYPSSRLLLVPNAAMDEPFPPIQPRN